MRTTDDEDLNAVLDAWRVEPASARLREAVLATAPKSRGFGFGVGRSLGLRLSGPRLWFAGAGVAAAVAGLSCGTAFATLAARESRDEAIVASATPDGLYALAAVAPPRDTP